MQIHLANLQQLALARLEPVLRGVLLKLQYADACLQPLPPGCTFDIEVHTEDRGSLPMHVWADDADVDSSPSPAEQNNILPIKTALLPGALQLQLYVES